MVVKVKYDNNADNGVVRWLHQLPEDRQYVDIRTKDMSKYGGPKDAPVNYGRVFVITDEADMLVFNLHGACNPEDSGFYSKHIGPIQTQIRAKVDERGRLLDAIQTK